MNLDEIRMVFDYNYWAFERVWECISQISDEQFVKGIYYSSGSLRNLVVHIMSANRNWMSRLQGIEMLPRLVFEDFDTLSGTKTKWDELKKEFLDYVDSLDEEELDETVRWELPARGLTMDNPRWQILLHLANHGTDHRAQILAMLHHHFDVPTVEQDMIIYLAEYH
jgi:uncharacterized damage-inducible protein DinB